MRSFQDRFAAARDRQRRDVVVALDDGQVTQDMGDAQPVQDDCWQRR
jgi:hypothetical protein